MKVRTVKTRLALQLRTDCLSNVEKGTDQIGRDTLAFANGIHC